MVYRRKKSFDLKRAGLGESHFLGRLCPIQLVKGLSGEKTGLGGLKSPMFFNDQGRATYKCVFLLVAAEMDPLYVTVLTHVMYTPFHGMAVDGALWL